MAAGRDEITANLVDTVDAFVGYLTSCTCMICIHCGKLIYIFGSEICERWTNLSGGMLWLYLWSEPIVEKCIGASMTNGLNLSHHYGREKFITIMITTYCPIHHALYVISTNTSFKTNASRNFLALLVLKLVLSYNFYGCTAHCQSLHV